jgi:hypothetical protein
MGRLYLPLDVMFCDDEKIVAVGERPAWLYLAMCLKAKQLATGGYLTEQQVAKLAVPGWKTRLRPLLAAQLVEVVDERYFIPAWANWNDTAEQIEERRRKDRERKVSARNPNGVQTESARSPNGFQKRPRSDSLLVEGSSSSSEVVPPTPPAGGGATHTCQAHKRPRRGCPDCTWKPRSTTDDRVAQAIETGRRLQALADAGQLGDPPLRAIPGGAA